MNIIFAVILLLSVIVTISGQRWGRWKWSSSSFSHEHWRRRPHWGGGWGWPGYNRGFIGPAYYPYQAYGGWGK
ncbi:sulfur globule protein CV3 domain protein [Teladorsagia circumcincta]|uniref:Sulfur globule protein CV3 domain protein n=1 Tax=Teladorsagia circumcincta TaxID=45464 RepID=A0A2G9UN03_TELCI|nr:sulfur globule protein CV3 domain protein [Teladorsagia circumcincta]PIO71605.1 sulfur globule protein CV3 domain protein [Teladorsagia circumcincta]